MRRISKQFKTGVNDMNKNDMNKKVLDAIDAGDHKRLEELAKDGADLSSASESGRTPVFHAVWRGKGDDKCLAVLVKYGADLKATDETNSAPAHIAVINGNYKHLQILAENGSPLEVINNWGRTPYSLTPIGSRRKCAEMSTNLAKCAEILIKHDADW